MGGVKAIITSCSIRLGSSCPMPFRTIYPHGETNPTLPRSSILLIILFYCPEVNSEFGAVRLFAELKKVSVSDVALEFSTLQVYNELVQSVYLPTRSKECPLAGGRAMNHTMKLFLAMITLAAPCAFTIGVHAQSLSPEELQNEPAASYKDDQGRFIYDSAAPIGSKATPRVAPTVITTPVQLELPRARKQSRPQGGKSNGQQKGVEPKAPGMRGRPQGPRRPAPPADEMMQRVRQRQNQLARRAEMLARREGELSRHREELAEIERRLARRKRKAGERQRELDGLAEHLAQQEHDLVLTRQNIDEVTLEQFDSDEETNLGALIAVGSVLVVLILWICALIDCLRRSQDDFPARGSNEKLVWVIVLLFTSALGALLYVFLVRGRPRSTE